MASAAASKTVLLLGSGMCAPPIIQYLSSHNIAVIVANRTLGKADKICSGLSGVTTVQFDIESADALEALDALVQRVDLVVSLLPYIHHVKAARVALKHKKHFCTTSYVSDEMASLDEEAKAAGVILLNELGVDPGLDLASAQQIIDRVHSVGGKILTFLSICGGLPAPADNNNPLGYKLSWSPRGVLLAARNNALFLENGQHVTVPSARLFIDGKHNDNVSPVGDLEWYPNRDSVKFIDIHNAPEVQTLIRGTYRYPGWCHMMTTVATLQLLSTDVNASLAGMTYATFARTLLQDAAVAASNVSGQALKEAFAAQLGLPADDAALHKLEWLGLFSDDIVIPQNVNTRIDALCHLWQTKLGYAEKERDMIVMKHTFEIEYRAAHRVTMESSLIDIGQQDQPDGNSSMARTVSLPVAAAARAVLEGRISLTGLQRPVVPELYNPVLEEMASLGICFREQELMPHIWIRDEVKPGEERVALVPADVAKLIAAGYRVSVESSVTRCIPDDAYAAVGAKLVATGSWVSAPLSAIILGLKELPESNDPLIHRHVYFAHCFKNQSGWSDLLKRFNSGKGMLWDLEFLVDDNGRRVAAFGRAAGIAGMAVAILNWCQQRLGDAPLPAIKSWPSTQKLVDDVKARLAQVGGQLPSTLVLGALGRVGGGAAWFAEQVGLPVTRWDMAETSKGGPFPQLLEHEILANCIYLSGKIPPFLTRDMLSTQGRKLSVFTDISCDFTSPNNPFPIYNQLTTLPHPSLRIVERQGDELPLDVISIDHLPTAIPNDASTEFSSALIGSMLNIHNVEYPVWKRAEDLYHSKLQAALQQ